MGKELELNLMVQDMKENSYMENIKEKEYKLALMEKHIKENSKTEKEMDMEF